MFAARRPGADPLLQGGSWAIRPGGAATCGLCKRHQDPASPPPGPDAPPVQAFRKMFLSERFLYEKEPPLPPPSPPEARGPRPGCTPQLAR